MRKVIPFFLVFACAALTTFADPATNQARYKHVLFVCTGNFYRSRFAEALFTKKSQDAHLDWRAISRGLKLVSSQHGISPIAKSELLKRGVPQQLCQGNPTPLTREDLDKSEYVVVMDETEERPLLEKLFPTCDNRKIHYWHIGDTGKMEASTACEAMTHQIEELIREAVHQRRAKQEG